MYHGVAVAEPLRDEHHEHEWDEQCRREHERACDDEGRRGVEAVVTADCDAEHRRDRRERQEERGAPPLVAGGDAVAQGCHRGDGGQDVDQGGVGGR